MVFNFNLDVARVSPVQNEVYDGSDASGWEAFAPAWAGQTAVMYRNESSAQLRQNPVGCTKNSNNLAIYFKLPNSQASFANGAFGTINRLNLSGYTKLHVQATYATSAGIAGLNYCVCGVITANDKNPPIDGTNTPPGTYKTMSAGETILDISNINSGYLYFGGMSRANGPTTMNKEVDIRVTKVWLT